jgi:tRNA (mo5U34)-methyltransferase
MLQFCIDGCAEDMNYSPLIERWSAIPELALWARQLEQQIAEGLSHERYGDLARWLDALNALPELPSGEIIVNESRVGLRGSNLNSELKDALITALKGLHPWRKGPYRFYDVHIDTEWRSDWKWDRVSPHLSSLRGRRILDIGCGSGYHCWRMLGSGASEVVGIDPTPLFVVQFWAIQKYLQQKNINVLPLGVESIPEKIRAFDTVFSMGILYHRRSPFDHLTQLRDCLISGGELVLETLIVEGDENTVFVPPGRYARMGNVWCLPSTRALERWLAKVGFKHIRTVDVSRTSVEEQRQTDWMQFHSLQRFLDPNDPNKTIEGHPGPVRATLIATAP